MRALVRYERCQNTCYFLLLLSLSGTCRYDNWADSVRFADYRKKDQCTWAPLHAPLSQEISRTSDNRIAQTQRDIRLDPVVICCPCPRHLQRKTLHQAIVLLVESHENPMLLEYGARGCCGRGREYRVSSDGERFVPKYRCCSTMFGNFCRGKSAGLFFYDILLIYGNIIVRWLIEIWMRRSFRYLTMNIDRNRFDKKFCNLHWFSPFRVFRLTK